jgi:hypothetical protein
VARGKFLISIKETILTITEGMVNKDELEEEEVETKMVEIPIKEDAVEADKAETEDEIQTFNPRGVIIVAKTEAKQEAIHKKSGKTCRIKNVIAS